MKYFINIGFFLTALLIAESPLGILIIICNILSFVFVASTLMNMLRARVFIDYMDIYIGESKLIKPFILIVSMLSIGSLYGLYCIYKFYKYPIKSDMTEDEVLKIDNIIVAKNRQRKLKNLKS